MRLQVLVLLGVALWMGSVTAETDEHRQGRLVVASPGYIPAGRPVVGVSPGLGYGGGMMGRPVMGGGMMGQPMMGGGLMGRPVMGGVGIAHPVIGTPIAGGGMYGRPVMVG